MNYITDATELTTIRLQIVSIILKKKTLKLKLNIQHMYFLEYMFN